MSFPGFPRGTRYTPVPNQLFGPLLEAIDDVAELKCTLRAIWLLHQKKGYPRYLTLGELMSDRVLLSAIRDCTEKPGDTIRASMEKAVCRGSFLAATIGGLVGSERAYLLNTEPNRKAMPRLLDGMKENGAPGQTDGQALPERPNIFLLYEQNIGMLTPLIGEKLKEAGDNYPAAWTEEAFKLAVQYNQRKWIYIERILERWATEGKDDGEPRRHPQKGDRQRYLKEYLRRRGSFPSP